MKRFLMDEKIVYKTILLVLLKTKNSIEYFLDYFFVKNNVEKIGNLYNRVKNYIYVYYCFLNLFLSLL